MGRGKRASASGRQSGRSAGHVEHVEHVEQVERVEGEDVSVKALIVRDERVLMLKRWSYSGDLFWDVPGGRASGDEPKEATLARELEEELGYFGPIKVGRLVATKRWDDPASGQPPKALRYYAVSALVSEPVLSEEHAAYSWLSSEDLAGLHQGDCRLEPELEEVLSVLFDWGTSAA